MKQNFNILITGVGGQGLVTLVDVLAKAILADGKDVKSSELHGLSQRGGAVAVYVSMGKKVHSPLFKKGDADLILGLDLLEGLRSCDYINKNMPMAKLSSIRDAKKVGIGTKLLINDYLMPFAGVMPREEILVNLKKMVGDNLKIVEASKICKEKMQKEILATMYLLGFAVYNKYLDLKPESVIIGMQKAIPEKYLQINIDAFNLAKN